MILGGRTRVQLEADVLADALAVLRVRALARATLVVDDFSVPEHRDLWQVLARRDPEGKSYEELAAFVAEVWEVPLPVALRWLLGTCPGTGTTDDIAALARLR